jgi:5,10-methylenetetrahydromethanopterin reductase
LKQTLVLSIRYIFREEEPVQLAIGVTSGMKMKRILKLSATAEKHGLNRVWIGEDILAPHDVFVSASAILLGFKELRVGIGVTSPLVRNISTIARATASLSEIDNQERITLGLGIGGLQDLRKLGIKANNPRDILRDATALLKAASEGETVTFTKGNFSLMRYHARYASEHETRIFFGVRGPQLLYLAGEVSDGVILSGPRTYLRKVVSLVREAIKKSERPERNFEFVVWVPTVLVKNSVDLKLVKNTVAFVLADTPRGVLELAGIRYDDVSKIREVYQKHGIARASKLITPSLLNEVAVHGDSRKILEEFNALEESGIQEVVFGPPYGRSPEAAANELVKSWRRYS